MRTVENFSKSTLCSKSNKSSFPDCGIEGKTKSFLNNTSIVTQLNL